MGEHSGLSGSVGEEGLLNRVSEGVALEEGLPDWNPDSSEYLGIHSHMIELIDTVFQLQ